MKRLVVIGAIVALIAIIPTELRAQEAWMIDSVRFERNWPDSLVGRFLNTETVLPLPWGGTAFGVRGLTQQSLLGVWIEDAEGNRFHSNLPLPTGTSRSVRCVILAKDENDSTMLLAGTDAGPYGSHDGRTWFARSGLTIQQLDEGERSWWFDISDLLDEGNGRWWAVSGIFGVAFTSDYGQSWQLINGGLYHRGEALNTGRVYRCSDGQIWLQGEDALYRLDRPDVRDGNTWEWIPLRDGIEYNLVDGQQRCRPILATFPDGKCDDGGLMYSWTGWGLIYRSEDSGENWEQMTERDDEWWMVGVGSVIPTMVVSESGLVFLGAASGGLFVSNDRGDNWLPIGGRQEGWEDNEPTAHYRWWHDQFGGILDLAFDPNGYLLIGTWDGVIRSTVPMNGPLAEEEEPDLVVPNPELPETIELLSVYPNPFNGILRVNINAESNQPYSVSVLDVTGRLVTVLSQGIGSAQLVWNASNNPSGLYWIQVSNNDKNLTKGVYLVR